MGKCRYCGKPAGLFRTGHTKCKASFHLAFNEIVYVTHQSILDREAPSVTEVRLSLIASAHHIPVEKMRSALAKGWGAALGHFVQKRPLSEEAEATLVGFKEYFALAPEELDAQPTYTRFGKATLASRRKLPPTV